MQLANSSISAIKAASTPEEAAKVFYREVSKGLAGLIADAMSKALSSASTASAAPSVAGWEQLIGGVVMQMNWESPETMKPLPMAQIACFAPYPTAMAGQIKPAGVNVSIGVSIGATF